FGRHPGFRDIDPSIESAFGSHTAKTRNLVQVARKLLATLLELADHARGSRLAVPQRFNRGILGKFGNASICVHRQHIEVTHRFWWRNGISEPPARHSETLRK